MAGRPIPLVALLRGIRRGDRPGDVLAHVGPEWMQGRTTYGGCSAALCLQAARQAARDAQQDDGHRASASAEKWPLRSAQVAFLGPVAGDVRINAAALRSGKSMQHLRTDIVNPDGSVSATGIFSFGSSRKSQLNFLEIPGAPDSLPPPTESQALPRAMAPQFEFEN